MRVPSNGLRVCQEEVFGPFVAIQRFGTVDEAVAIANDSDFGLVSYLWSDDLPSVMQASRRIKAGTVWVNTPLTRDLRARLDARRGGKPASFKTNSFAAAPRDDSYCG